MTNESTVEIRLACEDLITAYCHAIDLGDATAVADLFTDDGVWSSAEVTMRGAGEIRAGFGRRAAMERRSAHVCTNVAVTVEAADRATGVCYFTLFRHDGPSGPVAPLAGPAMVGVYRDRFARTADGWRFAERVAEARFVARRDAD